MTLPWENGAAHPWYHTFFWLRELFADPRRAWPQCSPAASGPLSLWVALLVLPAITSSIALFAVRVSVRFRFPSASLSPPCVSNPFFSCVDFTKKYLDAGCSYRCRR